MKVVITRSYGGFELSEEQLSFIGISNLTEYGLLKGQYQRISRTDLRLIEAVLTYPAGDLKVVEIPDDIEWTIEEYDGLEWIAEKHRTWR